MAFINGVAGDYKTNYSAADVSKNALKPGMLAYDEGLRAWFKFLTNGEGASAIAASLVVMALGTDKHLFKVHLPTGDDMECFAGVRIVGASSLAAGESGWFQISGPASFIYTSGGTNITADNAISNKSTAGKVQKSGTPGTSGFAIAEAAASVDLTVVLANINRNVWGNS